MSRREEFDPFNQFRAGLPEHEDRDDLIIKDVFKHPKNFHEIGDLIPPIENYSEKPLGGFIDDEAPEKPKVVIVAGQAYIYTETEAGTYEYRPLETFRDTTGGECIDDRISPRIDYGDRFSPLYTQRTFRRDEEVEGMAGFIRDKLHGIKTDEDFHGSKEINSINSIDMRKLFPGSDESEDYYTILPSESINSWDNPYDHRSHFGDMGQDMISLGEYQARQRQEMRNRRLMAVTYGTAITVEVPLMDESGEQPPLTLEDAKQAAEMLAAMDVEKPWYLSSMGNNIYGVTVGRLALCKATIKPLHIDGTQISSRNLGFIKGLEGLTTYEDNPFDNPDKDGNVRLLFEKDFGDTTTEQQVSEMLAYLATRPE